MMCERSLVGDVEALNSLAATCTQLRSLAREPSLYRRLYLSDLRPSALHPDSLRPMLSDAYLRLVVDWADGRLEVLDITNCVQLSESAVMEVLELQPKLTTLLAARHCTARRLFAGSLMVVLSGRRRRGWPALLTLEVGALNTACAAGDDSWHPPRYQFYLPQQLPATSLSHVGVAVAALSTLQSHCNALNVDSVCTNCFCLMAGPKVSWCCAVADRERVGGGGGVPGGADLPIDAPLGHCVEKVWCERCMIRAASAYNLTPLIAFRCSSCADVLLPGMCPPDYCVGCMITYSGACCSACSRAFVPGCVSCRVVQRGGGGGDETDLPKQCNACGAKFCKHCATGSCLWCGVHSAGVGYTLIV